MTIPGCPIQTASSHEWAIARKRDPLLGKPSLQAGLSSLAKEKGL
jgi:hypothetical protein